MAHIIIVGYCAYNHHLLGCADLSRAGVVGLQTAITLLEEGYKVSIIAKHWPGDESVEYTSPWAGAIWRTHATPDQVEWCKWDVRSYQEWMRIINDEPVKAQAMGIQASSFIV